MEGKEGKKGKVEAAVSSFSASGTISQLRKD